MLNQSNYCELKSTDHVLIVIERVVENISDTLTIGEM